MKTSESITKVAPALVAAAAAVTDIVKDTKNDFGGYQYATLDQLTAMLRPVLAKHGLMYTQELVQVDGMAGTVTRVLHSSGEWIETEPLLMAVQDRKGMTQAQAVGSVFTYGRRYALQALFGIAAEADDDASGTVTESRTVGNDRARKVAQMQAQRSSYPRRGDPNHGITEEQENDPRSEPDFL
jgi:hypothetical protein